MGGRARAQALGRGCWRLERSTRCQLVSGEAIQAAPQGAAAAQRPPYQPLHHPRPPPRPSGAQQPALVKPPRSRTAARQRPASPPLPPSPSKRPLPRQPQEAAAREGTGRALRRGGRQKGRRKAATRAPLRSSRRLPPLRGPFGKVAFWTEPLQPVGGGSHTSNSFNSPPLEIVSLQ